MHPNTLLSQPKSEHHSIMSNPAPKIARKLAKQAQRPGYFVMGDAGLKTKVIPNTGATTIANVVLTKQHVAALNSQDPLKIDSHPRHFLVTKKYAERKDPLWWNVLGKVEVHPRVVRSWAINRTRVAFKAALKKKGFDEKGNRLEEAVAAGYEDKPLTGSVQFLVTQGAVAASWAEVKAEAERILERVMDGLYEEKIPLKSNSGGAATITKYHTKFAKARRFI